MKKIVLCLLIILTGCTNKDLQTHINISKTEFEYGEKVILSDIVTIENGRLYDENLIVKTDELGNIKMSFNYYNEKNKIKKGLLNINVVDKETPVLFNSSKYYTLLGKEINLLDKPIYGDNADRNVKLEVIGEYDINKLGEYPLKYIISDESGNKKEENFTLVVTEKLPTYSPMPDVKIEDFIKKHKTENTKIGIDVSTWQDDIDFSKVKAAGVEFVIIRIGYGHKDDKIVMDDKFIDNIKKAKEASLPVGVYFYSYAKTKEEANIQANWIVDNLQGQTLDLPIVFDWEIWNQFSKLNINFLDLNNIAKEYLDTVTSRGYKPMLYSSMNYLNKIWDLNEYPTWLAHYTKNTDKSSYQKDYSIWQASDRGIVDGIKGYVDLNVMYSF